LKTLLIVGMGLALAFAGFYVSSKVHIPFQETLQHQGIPLDLGKTVAMIGMFLVLFPVLNIFYFRPLKEAINQRTSDLEQTFAEAENLRAEMTQMRTEYEQRLAQTEAQAREQIQAQIREAQALRDSLRQEAVQQAEELKRSALADIEQEKLKILHDLRLHVVNLTLQATERLVGETVDDAKNRRLVEEFIDKVEVAG
jgi:F-type H+-transporting ATPase subunit b